MLESYKENGSGTVQGTVDRDKQAQIEFWERAAEDGFTDEAARTSALKFRTEFEGLENRLARQPYLMGDHLSVVEIAWFIYAHRLSLAGYPFGRLHSKLQSFLEGLRARPEFAREIGTSPDFDARLKATRDISNRRAKHWRGLRACN